MCVCITACVWRSEDNLVEFILSLDGSGYQTQGDRLASVGDKNLYPVSHLKAPVTDLYCKHLEYLFLLPISKAVGDRWFGPFDPVRSLPVTGRLEQGAVT